MQMQSIVELFLEAANLADKYTTIAGPDKYLAYIATKDGSLQLWPRSLQRALRAWGLVIWGEAEVFELLVGVHAEPKPRTHLLVNLDGDGGAAKLTACVAKALYDLGLLDAPTALTGGVFTGTRAKVREASARLSECGYQHTLWVDRRLYVDGAARFSLNGGWSE